LDIQDTSGSVPCKCALLGATLNLLLFPSLPRYECLKRRVDILIFDVWFDKVNPFAILFKTGAYNHSFGVGVALRKQDISGFLAYRRKVLPTHLSALNLENLVVTH
jgi:hypothetical protein